MPKDGDKKQIIHTVCMTLLERNSLDDQITSLIEKMGEYLYRHKLEGKLKLDE